MPEPTRRALLETIGSAAVVALSGPALAATATPRTYQQRVLAKHPVAYWRFEERAGTTAGDSTGHGHSGFYRGGVAFSQPGAIHTEPDAAIGLNGVDAFVEVADSAAFSQPTSRRGLTVEAWFRPDRLMFPGQTDAHYIHWLGKGQAGEFEWGFRFYSRESPRPNRVSAYIWNPTVESGVSNEGAGAYFQDELQAGGWIHVVACYDPGNASNPLAGVSIYKNGVLRGGPGTSPGARYASFDIHSVHGSSPVRLGTRDLGSFLAGGLDDVAIYPRVLSASQILDNYAGA
jgi:hypothetical protein